MRGPASAFGIDFGTTNTRVAFYDGTHVRMVQFETSAGLLVQYPTLISYQSGEPVAFGPEAKEQSAGTLFGQPIKWILDQDVPLEVEGGKQEPVEIVAAFLKNLRALAEKTLRGKELNQAAVTIPVHYSPKARMRLEEAFEQAGIKVTHFFFEPIAAIYSSLLTEPVAGPVAVFDWGGGSLDIASVQIRDGIALTRQVDGWHRGGTNFDDLICSQAIDDYLSTNPNDGLTTETVLKRMKHGKGLRLRAEAAKVQLSRLQETSITHGSFLGGANLEYRMTRQEFDELIAPDVTGGIARLMHVLNASGVTPKVLARLYLSGGTCNIPVVRNRLETEITGKITSSLKLPAQLKGRATTVGLEDIGNATAIGAALLAVHGAEPVFASSVGVRIAESSGDRFVPVFEKGKDVCFQAKDKQFFVSDASSGVARLLICDDDDSTPKPGGRLLRVIPVPIDKDENWIDVHFSVDRHLVLKVNAAGRKNLRNNPFGKITWPQEAAWIQQLNLGFRVPAFAANAVESS